MGFSAKLYDSQTFSNDIDVFCNTATATAALDIQAHSIAINRDFKSEFDSFVALTDALTEALDALKHIIAANERNRSPLAAPGKKVINEIESMIEQNLIPYTDLPKLTTYVTCTSNVINNPTAKNIAAHKTEVKHMMGYNRQWVKCIANAALCFLGAVITIAALSASAATFGASTPLSSYGITAGVSLIGTGLSFFAGSAASRTRKGELAAIGEEVINIGLLSSRA